MIYDYLLVGHGLAGSMLAHTLSKAGAKILVLDLPQPDSASNVAAGLMNPLAGKRFAKSWLAEVLVPFARDFYRSVEAETGESLFHARPILKLFSSPEEQNNWMGKSAGGTYGDFIREVHTALPPSAEIHQELGGIVIDQGGFLDVPRFLVALRHLREARAELQAEAFDFKQLRLENNLVSYQGLQARKLIFCEGYRGFENPFFHWLPFSLNKGEVLDIESQLPENEYIYNKGVYVLGIKPGQWRVGATYNWRETDGGITAAARAELENRLVSLLKSPYRVVAQRAGIRPAVRDRRPLVGSHPHLPQLGIFNGMGSKGVMMAPYLAHHFVRVLQGAEELRSDINILRYLSFYKAYTPES